MDIVRILLEKMECRIIMFRLILAIENEFASQLQQQIEELASPISMNSKQQEIYAALRDELLTEAKEGKFSESHKQF